MCPLDRVLTYKNLIYLLNLQIHHEAEISQLAPDHLRIQGPAEGPGLSLLYPVSRTQSKGWKKLSWFLQSPVSIAKPQEMDVCHKAKQVNHFLVEEKFKMETFMCPSGPVWFQESGCPQ